MKILYRNPHKPYYIKNTGMIRGVIGYTAPHIKTFKGPLVVDIPLVFDHNPIAPTSKLDIYRCACDCFHHAHKHANGYYHHKECPCFTKCIFCYTRIDASIMNHIHDKDCPYMDICPYCGANICKTLTDDKIGIRRTTMHSITCSYASNMYMLLNTADITI